MQESQCVASDMHYLAGDCADGAATIICLKTVKIYRFTGWYDKRIKRGGGVQHQNNTTTTIMNAQ